LLVSLAAATASADVLDAVQEVVRRLDGPGSCALAAFNFTGFDLMLDRAEHDHGTFGTLPELQLPARSGTAFSLRSARSSAANAGRLGWRGTDPDRGDFRFEVVWSLPERGAPTACARAVHPLPSPGGRFSSTGDQDSAMAVETDFLRATSVVGTRRAVTDLYYELHHAGTPASAIGAFSRAVQERLGDPTFTVWRTGSVQPRGTRTMRAPRRLWIDW
jgi:hypothetical protein